jgi:two-component system chemotaxis response regulator CheY
MCLNIICIERRIKMRILVVDDSLFIRSNIVKLLKKNNFEVVGEASNGIEAVEKYKILKPSVVTMDVTMPEMDGREAVEEIIKFDPNAKIIMISIMGQESIVMKAIKSGAKGFLVKPVKEDRLVKEINRIKEI